MGESKTINKIDYVEIYTVRVPLVNPFETSFAVETHREALILKVTSGDIYGWGECVTSPNPFYSYETNSTAYHIIREFLFPILEKLKNFTAEDVNVMFKKIRGHNMAKATVENALLDLTARRYGLPLYKIIGGEYKRIKSGISIGIKEDINDLLSAIQSSVEKKYR